MTNSKDANKRYSESPARRFEIAKKVLVIGATPLAILAGGVTTNEILNETPVLPTDVSSDYGDSYAEVLSVEPDEIAGYQVDLEATAEDTGFASPAWLQDVSLVSGLPDGDENSIRACVTYSVDDETIETLDGIDAGIRVGVSLISDGYSGFLTLIDPSNEVNSEDEWWPNPESNMETGVACSSDLPIGLTELDDLQGVEITLESASQASVLGMNTYEDTERLSSTEVLVTEVDLTSEPSFGSPNARVRFLSLD